MLISFGWCLYLLRWDKESLAGQLWECVWWQSAFGGFETRGRQVKERIAVEGGTMGDYGVLRADAHKKMSCF